MDIRELNLAWLRAQYGLVAQEPDLFNSSLEYNILYGDPNAQLSAAAVVAEADAEANGTRTSTEVSAEVVRAAEVGFVCWRTGWCHT